MIINGVSKIQQLNGLITSIVRHPLLDNQFIIGGHEGRIYFFDLHRLEEVRAVRVFSELVTCMHLHEGGLHVGSKNGNLASVNLRGEILMRRKVHEDCISSIVKHSKYVVTAGFDGLVLYLSPDNLTVERRVDLQVPIFNAFSYRDHIYTAGVKSYRISEDCECLKLKRFNYYEECDEKLYGCSDEKGLTCVNSKTNTYMPCNFILPIREYLVIISDEFIGCHRPAQDKEWGGRRIKEIERHNEIVTGCAFDHCLILGDRMGIIYKISYQISDRLTKIVDEADSSEEEDNRYDEYS